MKQRTRQAWQELIKQQSEENLSILNFCIQHKINTSCFYKHKAIHNVQPPRKEKAFIKVEVLRPTISKLEPIKLQYGQTHIHLPLSVQSIWLADLVDVLT